MDMTADRAGALRLGIRLELITVVWMTIEAALAIGAGIVARSVLLTAFGIDSVIELISGLTLLWRLRIEEAGGDETSVDRVERRASIVSAALLVLLCAYVVISSAAGVVLRIEPEGSWPGIAVAAIAVLLMPWLATQKRRANRTLDSHALRADVAESVSCAFLAGVTLVGLAVSAATGPWWAQYVAAVALLVWLIPETGEALESVRG